MEPNIDFDDDEKSLNFMVNYGGIPRYFYKYVSIKTLNLILEGGKIQFAKPSTFNDPFDCNIIIDTENSKDEIDGYISLQKKRKKLNNNQVGAYKQLLYNNEERFKLTNQEVDKVKETFGISCFSSNNDNILMWAHYAKMHYGACLKFDILKDTELFMTPFRVVYKKKYPILNYIRQRETIAKLLIETKSKIWKYEDEIRVWKRDSGLHPFNKGCLAEIIFGCQTSNSDITLIKQNTIKGQYYQTIFKVAVPSNNAYKLIIKNYPAI